MKNFYFDKIVDHDLQGKLVDFDWRSQKEQGKPYDESNVMVNQKVLVTWVGVNCQGEEFAFSDTHLHQSVKRAIRIHPCTEAKKE